MVPLALRLVARLAPRGVPSGPSWLPRPRRVRLVALLAFRDEMEHLPGYVANVGPHVDGIVALDDGSTDGSAELLSSHPRVLEVLRVAGDRSRWDEVGNYRRLVDAALRHGADWAVSIDADERVERDFRRRAERVIVRGRWLGLAAYGVRMRELWDSPERYRSDGLWGRKRSARLFRLDQGAELDTRELHSSKAPVRAPVAAADLEVYHLGMIRPEDRVARRARYERLDPTARWQPREGYAYLTDPSGLELRAVPADRGWTE